MKKYQTIYADPPWLEKGGGKIKRGADKHYPLLKTEAIMDLGLDLSEYIETNAHLYLWVTNNFLMDGMRVMKAWGFTYKTMITWHKDRFGLGQYFRGNSEHCLFGVKGVLPYKTLNDKRQQGTTCFSAPRGLHSAKPHEMQEMIEKVSYPNFLEMFARQKNEGWDTWGNEINNDIKL